ncbi:hypothetical protein [Colwellia sp. MEBiC06753]
MLNVSWSLQATEFDVEDPYICKNTLANYQGPITPANGEVEQLINAVRYHCLDDHQASIETLLPVLNQPAQLSPSQLTYAYILHAINLNNIDDDRSCDMAKLSMVNAANTDSVELSIRAELNYFSFCDVYKDNIPHALKRLYELNTKALQNNKLSLQLTIHNQLSFVYYFLDQNQLSAEEGEKALAISEQMASDDYMVTLFNLIDAYLDAGEVALAEQRLALYQSKLTDLSTDWERYLYQYARTYLLYLQGNYQAVVDINNSYFQQNAGQSPAFIEKQAGFYGLACVALGDLTCVEQVVNQHFLATSLADIERLATLELLINWYSASNQAADLAAVHARYFDLVHEKLIKQQQATKVLGVAKLNNEIIRLNSDDALAQLAQQQRLNTWYQYCLFAVILLFAGTLIAYISLKRKVKRQVIMINEMG